MVLKCKHDGRGELSARVAELQRADPHVQAGIIFGIAIGLLIVAGGGYALWRRVKAARHLSEPA